MSTAPTSAAAATSSLQNLRTFRRFEIKFVVPESVAARFRDSLQPWMQPDAHSPAGGYGLESLYYDSPDLRFYWEKIDGERLEGTVVARLFGPGSGLGPGSGPGSDYWPRGWIATGRTAPKLPMHDTSVAADEDL